MRGMVWSAVVAPGLTEPGSVAATPVSQVDLFPTLADLCGVEKPAKLQGLDGRELYDHESDPRELTNLADDPAHADTLAELSATLRTAVTTTLPPSGETPKLTPGWWNVNLSDP